MSSSFKILAVLPPATTNFRFVQHVKYNLEYQVIKKLYNLSILP